MQTAATDGTLGSDTSGVTALRHSCSTRPGVSLPSSVVRSMHAIASRRPTTLACFLMLRVLSCAARSSSPTASTGTNAICFRFGKRRSDSAVMTAGTERLLSRKAWSGVPVQQNGAQHALEAGFSLVRNEICVFVAARVQRNAEQARGEQRQ